MFEETYEKYNIHGFCVYVTSYRMIDVDDYEEINMVLTMKEIIKFYIQEQMTEQEKKEESKKYLTKLRNKVIKGDYEAIDEANGIWPYMGGHCGYSYEIKCEMCTNGCDFY